ncbi:sensor histidine kinase, partial [Streptomyces sp. NPDC039022]
TVARPRPSGGPGPGPWSARTPGTRPVSPDGEDRAGLVSMRERVDALGGELTAGPTGDGGFRVEATMPLETADV